MYRSEIQLTPQIHEGQMAYYWHIFLIDGENKITVKHGWSKSIDGAYVDARFASYNFVK